MAEIKKIAVFTSGGDSPGMNACIRAVVRAGIYNNLSVYGIIKGYEGMIDGQIIELNSSSVGNIIQRGGTILKSARSKRFRTKEGMQMAYEAIKSKQIDAVVAIGGDGTFKGALEFSNLYDIPFIGLPGTIDNDLYGTDNTIGYDTAINTAMEAIDKIRDTADAHERLFFVEVMGKDAGFIALRSGIAAGAEDILIPEIKTDLDKVSSKLEANRHKNSSIVVVAEGDDAGGVFEIANIMKKRHPEYDIRVTVLGHLQRGGSPTVKDRILASRLGIASIKALLNGKKNVMIGIINDEIAYTPFEEATKHHIEIKPELKEIIDILSI